jgi:hypothetical protein
MGYVVNGKIQFLHFKNIANKEMHLVFTLSVFIVVIFLLLFIFLHVFSPVPIPIPSDTSQPTYREYKEQFGSAVAADRNSSHVTTQNSNRVISENSNQEKGENTNRVISENSNQDTAEDSNQETVEYPNHVISENTNQETAENSNPVIPENPNQETAENSNQEKTENPNQEIPKPPKIRKKKPVNILVTSNIELSSFGEMFKSFQLQHQVYKAPDFIFFHECKAKPIDGPFKYKIRTLYLDVQTSENNSQKQFYSEYIFEHSESTTNNVITSTRMFSKMRNKLITTNMSNLFYSIDFHAKRKLSVHLYDVLEGKTSDTNMYRFKRPNERFHVYSINAPKEDLIDVKEYLVGLVLPKANILSLSMYPHKSVLMAYNSKFILSNYVGNSNFSMRWLNFKQKV